MRYEPENHRERSQRSQAGFTLVELLVVVGIVVALAAVSVVSVLQFAGKGEQGATSAEIDSIQAAMDTMMADKGITTVTANDLGSSGDGLADFAAVPSEGPLAVYVRQNPTTYYYCWDSTGKISQLLTASTSCPAGPY